MVKTFDLVVIGTGSAAATAAAHCRSAGWTVAVIDSRPYGGTCALRGCDPKKVLVGASEAVDWVRRMKGKGIRSQSVRIDWAELIRFKRTFTDPVPKSREAGFKKSGIETFHGRARFEGPRRVRVGGAELEGRYVLIATGATPATLNIPGEEFITTSDQFLELKSLPKRVVFIGGGYISFEFAHVAARAGARATILHRGERPLELFDPDLVGWLVEKTHRLGIKVQLRTQAEAIERSGKKLKVRATASGKKCSFEADLVVHGAGRVAEIDDLNLAVAGVEAEKRGVKVNSHLQSVSNPAVYAAGDAAASGGMPLTPVADYEGGIVAENLLNGNRAEARYLAVPSVVYTTPPLATVGLSEREATLRELKFKASLQNTSGWYSSRRVGEDCSGSKVLVEEGSGRILGAHLLGPQAEELINVFAAVMRAGVSADQLREMIFAYPTHGSDLAYMV